MRIQSWGPVALAACCALGGGCVFSSTERNIGESHGGLVLDWTIAGNADPASCSRYGAPNIQVRLKHARRSEWQYNWSCDDLSMTIELPEGNYSGTAVLTDASGNPRTTVISIEPFAIEADTELRIPLDFPSDSFL